MTTQQLDETIVQLDRLYKAYSEIFEQAKSQLETLTLSNEDVKKLAGRLAQQEDFNEVVINRLNHSLIDTLKALTEEQYNTLYSSNQLWKMIAEKVLEQSKVEIANFVKECIDKELKSYRVDRIITEKVEEHDAIKSAIVVQKFVSDSIDLMIDREKKAQLEAEAREGSQPDNG